MLLLFKNAVKANGHQISFEALVIAMNILVEHISDIRFYCSQGSQIKTFKLREMLKIPDRAVENRAGDVPFSTALDLKGQWK